MEDAVNTITKINREFSNILKDALESEEIFSSAHTPEDVEKKIRTSSILIPSEYGVVKPLHLRAIRTYNTLASFWKENRKSYVDAIAGLSGLTILAQVDTYPELLTYFDTVITPDLSLQMCKDKFTGEYGERFRIHHLRHLYALRPLLEADTDIPLIALDTNDPESDLSRIENESARGQFSEKATADTIEALMRISKLEDLNIPLPQTLPEWLKLDGNGDVNVSNLFKLDEFIKLVLPDNYDEQVILRAGGMSRSELSAAQLEVLDFKAGKRDVISRGVYISLVFSEAQGIFETLAQRDVSCLLMRTDQYVDYPQAFRLKVEIESARTAHLANFNEELAVAQSLQLPPLKWINNLTMEEIKRFRETGGLDLMRNVFRKERKRIKYATLDDFHGIAQSVLENLTELVEEHNKEATLDGKWFLKKVGLGALSFTGMTALTIISSVVPPLAVIGVPLSVWGAIVGSASVKDLIDMVLTQRKNLAEIKTRPIGILARHLPAKT